MKYAVKKTEYTKIIGIKVKNTRWKIDEMK